MKKCTVLVLLVLVVLYLTGCGDENSGETPTVGIDTLTSDSDWTGGVERPQGFDFSEARVRYADINLFESTIDLSIDVLTAGNVATGAAFTLYGDRPFIRDMGLVSLEDVSEAPESGYVSYLINMVAGHTYCVVTAEGNYAKLFIMDMDWGNYEGGIPYAWIKFQWQFQPDGGRVF